MSRSKSAELAALLLICLPSLSAAENTLTPIQPPAERPYPYEILGLQPGDEISDVMAVFSERSEAEPTSEREIVQISSPDNRVFKFTYERYRRIGDVGINGRLAKANQDQLTAHLASTALEQRPLSIDRSIRQPSDELPDALSLRAQIEESYGPPSKVESLTGSMTLIYAWGEDGFISDLDAQNERELTYTNRSGQSVSAKYRPCTRSMSGAYAESVEYRFAYPRRQDMMPGCTAIFSITHESRPGQTSISFSLVDFDLGRIHRDGLDKQIVETLTGNTEVKPSNMDL